ncbi:tyrosine-type recombinase/integrase [Bacillus thuringiensis]|uniref:tyrosine-type recombinase/integrase n=1 Tax=Bacillus thuringiensis TaxID=1428 RepID=UPI0026E1DB68|nr:site-specific integrase [Bacillus thuringiensis]MDO6629183.1 site-specific integrase [Bacillus thuringiensis]MDO6659534.1 site-specific integrase [Bacillus thuringiensis]MDO6699278.1 site-specific integrase [Bacillus thuringiensis]
MAGSVKKDGNTWYYILELGKINGKRKQKKKRGFKTKREAQQALVEAEHSLLKHGTYNEPSKVLYKDYLHDWLEDKKITIKDSTFKTYSWLVEKYIIPYLGEYQISQLGPNDIQKFYSLLIGKNELSRENIQKIHSLINNSLSKAERWGMIKRNVASLVDRPKATKTEFKVWDVEEVKRFLKVAIESRYYVAFLLALTTGMRQGEILGVRWKDIDFNNDSLSVRQTLSHDGKTIVSGAKTKSSIRTIMLPKETINVLKEHKKIIMNEKKLGDILYNNNDLVVCTNIGTPCSPRNLLRVFYNLITKAEIQRIRFHDLRHTHATLLLKQGVNPKIVAEILGHSNIRITLDTYSHVLPSMQIESADKINKLFFE